MAARTRRRRRRPTSQHAASPRTSRSPASGPRDPPAPHVHPAGLPLEAPASSPPSDAGASDAASGGIPASITQPGTATCEHVVPLQLSVVHGSPSLQSATVKQQSAIGAIVQTPVAVSQVSVVQRLPSLQSASPLQQPPTPTWVQVSADEHASAVHTL